MGGELMEGEFPMQEVGVLELNRNPEDYHRDVEQAAFSPGSLVPGIELSPDTLLQWRAFLYVYKLYMCG
jgi:catalase